jgi:hypothetical protein
MSTVSVGANLTPVKSLMANELGRALNNLFRFIEQADSTKTLFGDLPAVKFFVKDGAPVDNTADDSPGSDLCFVWDKTNSDLYFIHTWSDSTHFTVVKVVD